MSNDEWRSCRTNLYNNYIHCLSQVQERRSYRNESLSKEVLFQNRLEDSELDLLLVSGQ
jgi:hypothetical protein